jgi:hypothetical protein
LERVPVLAEVVDRRLGLQTSGAGRRFQECTVAKEEPIHDLGSAVRCRDRVTVQPTFDQEGMGPDPSGGGVSAEVGAQVDDPPSRSFGIEPPNERKSSYPICAVDSSTPRMRAEKSRRIAMYANPPSSIRALIS